MKRGRTPVLATAAIASLTLFDIAATPAFALPPQPQQIQISGLYVGVDAGFAQGFNWVNPTGTGINPSSSPIGFSAGLYGGYISATSIPNFVVGFEFRTEYNSFDGGVHTSPAEVILNRSPYDFAISGRFGFYYIPGTYIMLTINPGIVVMHEESTRLISGVTFNSESATRVGWSIGATAEYPIANGWFGRADYRYADFGSHAYNGNAYSVKTTESRATLGVNYRFDFGKQ